MFKKNVKYLSEIIIIINISINIRNDLFSNTSIPFVPCNTREDNFQRGKVTKRQVTVSDAGDKLNSLTGSKRICGISYFIKINGTRKNDDTNLGVNAGEKVVPT